jgi:hypothetical protein
MVKEAWKNKLEVRSELVSPGRLHTELYFAIKMGNGRRTIGKSGRSLLIECGILALEPGANEHEIDLFQHELLIARSIEAHGDFIVQSFLLSKDPIFELLRSSQSDVSLEMLVTWHIVRA